MYGQSAAIISLWLSPSSSACHGLLIITVITPLPTKPSATKMPEETLKLATRQALLTCRCVSVMLLRSMQNTRRVADALSWKWCSAWWCCRWSSSVAHQSSLSVSAWPPPPGVDNAASPLADTAERVISPSKADHYAKNNWKNPKYDNEQCR